MAYKSGRKRQRIVGPGSSKVHSVSFEYAPGSALLMRVGGAFLVLAITLMVFALSGVIFQGLNAPFEVTPRVVAILLASAIIGGFATVSRNQRSSKTQVAALLIALGLIVFSRFLQSTVLYTTSQVWLVLYAGVAVACALYMRRKAAEARTETDAGRQPTSQ